MTKDIIREVKKKRKVQYAEDDVDIYRKCVQLEEKEALGRSSAADAKLYFTICTDIRQLLDEISTSSSSNRKVSLNVNDVRNNICLRIIMLKKLNRLEKIRQVGPREQLAAEKQKLDTINLQYQNLLYEHSHLRAEYQKCLQFKSKDSSIELVPVEEFLQQAPADLTAPFQGKNLQDDESVKHELRLARLEWELTQRKELADQCCTMEEEKRKLLQLIDQRKQKLQTIGPLLKDLIVASRPLQDHLDIPIEKQRSDNEKAMLLPDPLYVLYITAGAYAQVNDPNRITLEIVGDVDEANNWKRQQAENVLKNVDDEIIDYDGLVEDATNAELEASQNNDDEDDEEDVGRLPSTTIIASDVVVPIATKVTSKKRRHHSKTVSAPVIVDPMEEKRNHICRRHPLSVHIKFLQKWSITSSETSTASADKSHSTASLHMQVYYCTQLRLVTVKADVRCDTAGTLLDTRAAQEFLATDNILCDLNGDDDDGLTSPNLTTIFQLKKLGIDSFQSIVTNVGYAYDWIQSVCGLNVQQKKVDPQGNILFETKEHATTNIETRVESMMHAIRQRFQCRLLLVGHLQKLARKHLPSLPDGVILPRKPAISTLTEWSSTSWSVFTQQSFAKLFLEQELVSSKDFFYMARFSRGQASMEAWLVLKSNYPWQAPIFALCLEVSKGNRHHALNDCNIRDMERAINVHYVDYLNTTNSKIHRNSILALQMHMLGYCMDVYLETEMPQQYNQYRMFVQPASGKTRLKPFIFHDIGVGVFTT